MSVIVSLKKIGLKKNCIKNKDRMIPKGPRWTRTDRVRLLDNKDPSSFRTKWKGLSGYCYSCLRADDILDRAASNNGIINSIKRDS